MPFRAPAKDEGTAELRRLYPKSYPKSPKILFVDWPNIPFIKTGYASPSDKQVMTVGRRLAEPYKGRMLFAGEHTDMAFFGYMEGALRSGARAATKLTSMVCAGTASPHGSGAEAPLVA